MNEKLTLCGGKPRSNRPMLGTKSRRMGISRRDGTGLWRGWSRFRMLLARAKVASVDPPPRGSKLGSPAPPGPPPCQGESPLLPKFLRWSFRWKSMRRPPLPPAWGLRFAILIYALHENNHGQWRDELLLQGFLFIISIKDYNHKSSTWVFKNTFM